MSTKRPVIALGAVADFDQSSSSRAMINREACDEMRVRLTGVAQIPACLEVRVLFRRLSTGRAKNDGLNGLLNGAGPLHDGHLPAIQAYRQKEKES